MAAIDGNASARAMTPAKSVGTITGWRPGACDRLLNTRVKNGNSGVMQIEVERSSLKPESSVPVFTAT
jgi:hypothetical protein